MPVSSKGKGTMICDRMQSWNKFSISLMVFCGATRKPDGAISKFVNIRSYPFHLGLDCLNLLETLFPCVNGSPKRTYCKSFIQCCRLRVTNEFSPGTTPRMRNLTMYLLE